MDEIDRKLLALIPTQPRVHYGEVAKKLGISRQAAHRRIQALTEIRVIKGTTASISVSHLNVVPVIGALPMCLLPDRWSVLTIFQFLPYGVFWIRTRNLGSRLGHDNCQVHHMSIHSLVKMVV